ncbi:MAG TPA: hypothetical protein VF118_06025 [Gemmatimonadaceae bacterium]
MTSRDPRVQRGCWAALVVAVVALGGAASPAAAQVHVRVKAGVTLHDVAPAALRNANGSPRVADTARYEAVWRRLAPRLTRWAHDPRLGIDPGFAAALLAKESGGDSLAVSAAAALGVAQLTASADTDLRAMATSDRFAWMRREVRRWPRAPIVHDSGASAATIDSLLAAGALTSRTEYLFDPALGARAAVFWVRLLEYKWTHDTWPGGYGTFARIAIAGGHPLDDDQLADLVIVSYNRGYLVVHDLVARYGAQWTSHLPELGPAGVEAADYLDRVRVYAALFDGAPSP